jgi:hypothetical protein
MLVCHVKSMRASHPRPQLAAVLWCLSWKADNSYFTGNEIHSYYRTWCFITAITKVRHCPILSYFRLVYIPTHTFLKTHLITILPTHNFTKCCLSFKTFSLNFVCISYILIRERLLSHAHKSNRQDINTIATQVTYFLCPPVLYKYLYGTSS